MMDVFAEIAKKAFQRFAFVGLDEPIEQFQRSHRPREVVVEVAGQIFHLSLVVAEIQGSAPIILVIASDVDGESLLCYSSGNAEESSHSPGDSARDDGEAASIAGSFVHSLECAECGRLQTALLREQDLLRSLEKKQRTSRSAACPIQRSRPAVADRVHSR